VSAATGPGTSSPGAGTSASPAGGTGTSCACASVSVGAVSPAAPGMGASVTCAIGAAARLRVSNRISGDNIEGGSQDGRKGGTPEKASEDDGEGRTGGTRPGVRPGRDEPILPVRRVVRGPGLAATMPDDPVADGIAHGRSPDHVRQVVVVGDDEGEGEDEAHRHHGEGQRGAVRGGVE